MQNKVVKIVGEGNHRDRATLFYLKLGVLKLDFKLFEKTLFVFKLKMKSLPLHLDNYVRKVSHVSIRITRATYRDSISFSSSKHPKLNDQSNIKDLIFGILWMLTSKNVIP